MWNGTCDVTGHYTEQWDTSGTRKKTSQEQVSDELAEVGDDS